jgi:hypothetical protein
MGNIKIDDAILKSLRKHLAIKHEGDMHGKIKEFIENAVQKSMQEDTTK